MNKLVKTVKLNDLLPEFLQTINGILRLTNRELQVLVELIKLDVGYVKLPKVSKNIVDKKGRKHIMSVLNMEGERLSRFIKRFKELGLLIVGPAEDDCWVNPAIIPIIINDRVQITLILRVDSKEDEKINIETRISGNDNSTSEVSVASEEVDNDTTEGDLGEVSI